MNRWPGSWRAPGVSDSARAPDAASGHQPATSLGGLTLSGLPSPVFRLPSGKWPIDRRTLWREESWPLLGDVEAVFQPDAEFAVDRDHRFVAEAHAGGEQRRIALHEIGPLVPVHSDPVARAVGETGHLVARAKAGVGNDLAGGVVD